MMSSPSVTELLLRWRESHEQGQPVTPEELCRDCPELLDTLRRQIDALLSMEQMLGSSGGKSAGTDRDLPTVLSTPGESAGRPAGRSAGLPGYELLGELGRGGMGVVYKARQLAAERTVALKMILAGGHADAAQRQRFQTEAQAIARLVHPNIVQVHEVGEHEGLPFFSLEFCPGGSLAQQLRGTPLPPRAAAVLVEQLARAMQAAHDKGIIHRDLKPANVLLAEDGTPKITDFGLARKLDDTAGPTASGAVMGTPSYMAPEQARGRTQELGPAVDVYALGAILYECLTGRPPFRAATLMETLVQVAEVEPVAVRQLNPEVPRDLETVCLKCLHKDPRRRYVSAAALAEDLQRFLEDRPVLARPVGWPERTWRWCRRHPLPASLTLLTVLALAGLLGSILAALVLVGRSRDQAQRLAEQRQEALEAEGAQRRLAEKQLLLSRTTSYALQLSFAQREWTENAVERALQVLEECPADLSGWEQRYLQGLCRRRMRVTIPGNPHDLPHGQAALSADGRRAALAGPRRASAVHDALTGKELLRLGKVESCTGLALNRDGSLVAVATGGTAGTFTPFGPPPKQQPWRVVVRDVKTGKELFAAEGPEGVVAGPTFSPDGRLLAAGRHRPTMPLAPGIVVQNAPGEVLVWDLEKKREPHILQGLAEPAGGIAFSPDGRLVAACFSSVNPARKGGLLVWEVNSGREALALRELATTVGTPAFSPDGKRLAASCSPSRVDPKAARPPEVRVWEVEGGRSVLTLPLPAQAHTLALAYHPDGKSLTVSSGSLYSSDSERTVRLWDAATGLPLLTLRTEPTVITGLAYAPGGEGLVLTGGAGPVQVWDLRSELEYRSLPRASFQAGCVAFGPNGKLFTTVGTSLKAWDPATWREILAAGQQPPAVLGATSLAFHPSGGRVAVACMGGDVRVRDSATGAEVLAFKVQTAGPSPMLAAWSPDGRYLALSGGELHFGPALAPAGSPFAGIPAAQVNGELTVHHADTGAVVYTLKGYDSEIAGLAYAPDGRLFSADRKGTVKVWAPDSGEEPHTFRLEGPSVLALALAPDGKLLALAADDGSIRLWDAATGKEVGVCKGHVGWAQAVAFNRSGRRLVSGGQDGTVRVWDTATGQQLLLVGRKVPGLNAVVFSPDDRYLAATASDGLVRVWEGPEPNE